MKRECWFKILCITLVFFLLFQGISDVFSLKDFHEADLSGSINYEFYDGEEGYDIMFFGPSTTLHGIVATVLWGEYGITSWNWGTPNQFIFMNYYYIKEALNHNKPKVIALDAYSMTGGKELLIGDYYTQFSLYPMRMGKAKLEAVADLKRIRQQYAGEMEYQPVLQYVIPLYQFHNRWKELQEKDFAGESYSYKENYAGTRVTTFSEGGGICRLYYGTTDIEQRDEEAVLELDEISLEYFEKIYDLCMEEDIDLILYNVPTINWNRNKHDIIQKLADEYGIEYIDLCMQEDSIGIDYSVDAVDIAHLNLWGSYKATSYLGEILKDKYDFTDKRGQYEYQTWDEAWQECHETLEKGPMENTE